MKSRFGTFAAALALAVASLGAWQQPPQAPPAQDPQAQDPQAQEQRQGRGGNQPPQQPARDRAQAAQGTAAIAGRVVAADTGRPVKRARVTVSGAGRGGRSAATDEQGRYQISGLTAG